MLSKHSSRTSHFGWVANTEVSCDYNRLNPLVRQFRTHHSIGEADNFCFWKMNSAQEENEGIHFSGKFSNKLILSSTFASIHT